MPVENPASLVIAVVEFESDGVKQLVIVHDVGGEAGVVGGVAVVGLGEGVDVEMLKVWVVAVVVALASEMKCDAVLDLPVQGVPVMMILGRERMVSKQ